VANISPEENGKAFLSEADIAMFRYYRIRTGRLAGRVCRNNTSEVNQLGIQWRRDATVVLDGLTYLYIDPKTKQCVTYRHRPDHPPKDNSGKAAKYLSPDGDKSRRHLYFSSGCDRSLTDITVPVLLVESEMSVEAITDAAERAERPVLTLGCGGCMGWWGRIGKRLQPDGSNEDELGPLPDFYYIEWQGRDTVILFDSDGTTNLHVWHGKRRLAAFLTERGAAVRIAELGTVFKPDGAEKPRGKGPDDLIAELGDSAFWDVVYVARPLVDVSVDLAADEIDRLRKAKAANPQGGVIFGCEEAYERIAAVSVDSPRAQLIGQLAGLKLPGLTKALIQKEVRTAWEAMREEVDEAKQRIQREQKIRFPLDAYQLLGRDVREFFQARREIPEGTALIESLYCANTYTYDLFDTVAYLLYDSATALCGKSTSVERHAAICARAYSCANPTPAVIYRLIEQCHPTFILDEAEWLDSKDPRAAEVAMLYNAGYKRGAKVPRCEESGGEMQIRWFDVYGPKILAKIGSFTGTMLSRGIVIHLTKTYGLPQSFSRVIQREAAPLKERLEAYAVQRREALEELYNQQPDETYWPWLPARENELFNPLLLHARLIGEEFEKEVIAVVKAFTADKNRIILVEDERLSRALEVLEGLEEHLGLLLNQKVIDPSGWNESEANQIRASELLEKLSEKETWSDYLERRKNDKARTTAIGTFLRSFKPESKHDEKGTKYNLLDLSRKLARHLPPVLPLGTSPKTKAEQQPKKFEELLKSLADDRVLIHPPENSVKVSAQSTTSSCQSTYELTPEVSAEDRKVSADTLDVNQPSSTPPDTAETRDTTDTPNTSRTPNNSADTQGVSREHDLNESVSENPDTSNHFSGDSRSSHDVAKEDDEDQKGWLEGYL
jgi:hypothetical protein